MPEALQLLLNIGILRTFDKPSSAALLDKIKFASPKSPRGTKTAAQHQALVAGPEPTVSGYRKCQ